MSDSTTTPWPLVLYGPAGTGKSALAETLGCRLANNQSDCLMITGDDIRRQFLSAVATRSISNFRNRFQNTGVLILDQLELPDSEPAFCRELVQILDFFVDNNRPLLVTLRLAPWLISSNYAGLRSRLSQGLSISVQKPGLAAKRRIASSLLEQFDLKMSEQDLDWLVKALPDTAPLIKNHLSTVAIQSCDDRLDRDSFSLHSKAMASKQPGPDAVHELTKLVARQFNLRLPELYGKSRRKEVVRARSVAMYLTRHLMDLTFRQVGDLIGQRDPSTVRHAYSQIQTAISLDSHLAGAVDRIANRFQGYLTRKNV